jgi:hypothetical protein
MGVIFPYFWFSDVFLPINKISYHSFKKWLFSYRNFAFFVVAAVNETNGYANGMNNITQYLFRKYKNHIEHIIQNRPIYRSYHVNCSKKGLFPTRPSSNFLKIWHSESFSQKKIYKFFFYFSQKVTHKTTTGVPTLQFFTICASYFI